MKLTTFIGSIFTSVATVFTSVTETVVTTANAANTCAKVIDSGANMALDITNQMRAEQAEEAAQLLAAIKAKAVTV